MPTLSAHVPDDWEYKKDFSSRISKKYRGKPGPYIRELIENDLAHSGKQDPSPVAPEDILTWRRNDRILNAARRLSLDFLKLEGEQRVVIARQLALLLLETAQESDDHQGERAWLAAEDPPLSENPAKQTGAPILEE